MTNIKLPKKYKWVKTTCHCKTESDDDCYMIHREKRLISSPNKPLKVKKE